MGTHVRERESHVRSRRHGSASARLSSPCRQASSRWRSHHRSASPARCERSKALTPNLYPGAHRQQLLELPTADAFASPLFPDGTFLSGRMAMVSISADSFHEHYAAGLVCREDRSWFGGRARA